MQQTINLGSLKCCFTVYFIISKAFAHLGDMRTAFKIADEALNEGLKLSGDTYSFLLMACIADKEAGTSLSIKVC